MIYKGINIENIKEIHKTSPSQWEIDQDVVYLDLMYILINSLKSVRKTSHRNLNIQVFKFKL